MSIRGDGLSEFRLFSARIALGLVHSWEAPGAADRALVAGAYSPALAELSELRDPIMADVRTLVDRALHELHLGLSPEQGAWILARECMKHIATQAGNCE